MQFSIRALLVAMLLIAVATVTLPRNTSVLAAPIPGLLWVAGIASGILAARGRGLRCIRYAAIGGTVGAAFGAGAIGIVDGMQFASLSAAPILIALGGLSGAFLGCVVVTIMEGVVVRRK